MYMYPVYMYMYDSEQQKCSVNDVKQMTYVINQISIKRQSSQHEQSAHISLLYTSVFPHLYTCTCMIASSRNVQLMM